MASDMSSFHFSSLSVSKWVLISLWYVFPILRFAISSMIMSGWYLSHATTAWHLRWKVSSSLSVAIQDVL